MEQDGQVARGGQGADFLQQIKSGIGRFHHHVQQHQIEMLAGIDQLPAGRGGRMAMPNLQRPVMDHHATQRQVDQRWNDKADWRAAAINNVARVGWFSSDRTIREYAKDIWGVL